MTIEPALLEHLVCPSCRGELELVDEGRGLRCPAEGLRYPVVDGVPWLIPEKAEKEPSGS